VNLDTRLGRFVWSAWLPVVIVTLWWVISANSVDPFFPPLSEIVARFRELWIFDLVPVHLLPSLRNLFLGYALGATIGLVAGAYLGASRNAYRYFEPLVDFLRSIPPVATVPIFILIYGLDASMRVAAITFATIFPVLIATIQGVRGTDPLLMDICKVFQLSRFDTLWRVRMPSAGPTIASGLRLALQIAFIVTIASELLGSGFGLGAFTLISTQSYMIVDGWTGVILLGLLGYALNLIFGLIEGRVMRWYFSQKKIASQV
jgi:sulfonate transport system permease protein